MKKILLSTMFSTFSLVGLNAMAAELPAIHGPITFNWTVDQKNADSITVKTNYIGSGKNRETNVLQNTKHTFSTVTYNNAKILALLENSLNTTFPAGTKLETDGSTLYVVDNTGTNTIDVSSVVTGTTSDPVTFGLDSTVTTSKASGTTSTTSGNGTGKEIIIINYDDSSLTTKDGTTTTFTFVGESASTDSGSSTTSSADVTKIKESGSFSVKGAGYGTIHSVASNISGTLVGAFGGTETFSIP